MPLELGGIAAAPRPGQNQLVATLPSANRRGRNQDAYFFEPLRGLGAVIDGMGGHAAGAIAASLGRVAISQLAYRRNGEGTRWPLLALTTARNRMARGQDALENDMGATAVAAAVEPYCASIAWCGDARAYGIFAGGGLKLLTRDHGLVDDWRRMRLITEDQAVKLEEMLDNSPAESLANSYGAEIEGLSDLLTRDPDMVKRWLKDDYIVTEIALQLYGMLANAADPEVARYIGGKIAAVVFRNRAQLTCGLGFPDGEIGHIVIPTHRLLAVLLVSDGIPDNLTHMGMTEVVRETVHDLHAMSSALVSKAREAADFGAGRSNADDMTALVLPVPLRQLTSPQRF